MKKILLLVLSLVLCLGLTFGLASCVGGEDNNDGGNETPAVSQDLQDAMDFLWDMYRNSDNAETASNFDRTAVVPVGDVKFAVEWTVDNDAISIVEKDDSTVTIKVPEKPSEAISYKLTATIKDSEGNSVSKTFNHVVPKFKVLTFDEYRATESGKSVVIEGIVAGINSTTKGNKRNHLFLVDESGKGGYYVYDSEHDPIALGIEIGMKVRVSGPLDIYKDSIYEIIDGDGKVMEITIVNSEKVPVTAIDITESFAAGNDLYAYVGALVTIKGVELGTQDLENSNAQYLYFKLNGVESYVRTYVTDLEAGIKSDETKAAIDADHLAHFGYKADVTGLLVYYGTTPYIIPVSLTPFTNYQEVEKTDAEKVAAELGDIKLDGTITADTVINVITAGKFYDDVVISWESDNAAIVYADGKLTVVVPDTEISVKITVTATCGEATDSKEITVKLSKKVISAGAANEIATAVDGNNYTSDKYLVGGVIVEIKDTKYGNMYIVDEQGNKLYIYGVYTKDGVGKFETLATKPAVGDYIVVLGILGKYNNAPQMKSGWLQEHVPASTIKDANTAGEALEGGKYTDDKYLVTGKVTEIANTQYGNLYIEDAEGNRIYIYGLYDVDGNRYDKMTTKPAVGDTITVMAAVNKYVNGSGVATVQLKNATVVVIEAAAEGGDDVTPPEGGDDPETPDTPAAGVEAGKGYYISASNASDLLYFDGTISSGRFNAVADKAKAAVVYVEAADGGFYIYILSGETKQYIVMDDKSAGGAFADSAASATVFTWNADLKTLVVLDPDTARAFGMQTTSTYANFSCYATSNTTGYNWGAFELADGTDTPETPDTPEHTHVFVDGKCECGAEDPDYVAPEEPGDEPSVDAAWVPTTELKNGDLVLIGAAKYGKLLSAEKVSASSFYNKGVDYSATDFANVTDAEIFTVTVNDDGTYTFTSLTGKVIALADSYGSLNDTGANKYWSLERRDDGTFLVKNTGRNLYLEWYASKDNWSTYSNANSDLFYMTFYVKASSEGTDTPEVPEHTHVFVDGKCECGEADPDYVPEHTHTFVDGKCECGAEDPDYVAPEVSANKADFETMGDANASYTTRTSANGWVATNAALNSGNSTGTDSNPKLGVLFGTDVDMRAVTLNGKISAKGTLTSPVLSNGISSISFKCALAFTDKCGINITINIKNEAGEVVATKDVVYAASEAAKYDIKDVTWTLDTAVEGNFVIEILNNAPSNLDKNQDRTAIWNLTWVNA